MSEKKDIRELSLEQIQEFCLEHKMPKFRAKQVWEWLWKKRAVSFEEMTSLSKDLRELFYNNFAINAVKIHKAERSIDGTIKYSLQLHDKLLVEGVIIPSKNRLTACVSSQVGCSLACEFCARCNIRLHITIRGEQNETADSTYRTAYHLIARLRRLWRRCARPDRNTSFSPSGFYWRWRSDRSKRIDAFTWRRSPSPSRRTRYLKDVSRYVQNRSWRVQNLALR